MGALDHIGKVPASEIAGSGCDMTSSYANRAGKGLQKQLLISDNRYTQEYERIFGKKRKLTTVAEPIASAVSKPSSFLDRAKRAVTESPRSEVEPLPVSFTPGILPSSLDKTPNSE
jgi:hypothetical protein